MFMQELLEYSGRGARIIALALAWAVVPLTVIFCAPFFLLGWIGYRLGWID